MRPINSRLTTAITTGAHYFVYTSADTKYPKLDLQICKICGEPKSWAAAEMFGHTCASILATRIGIFKNRMLKDV